MPVHPAWRGSLCAAALTAMACAGCGNTTTVRSHAATPTPHTPSPHAAGAALSIAGNAFVDSAGSPVRLLGVNRAGTEYACAQGWNIFDGPSDAASVAAMAAWHINTVRIPLNEDCWLGINGVKPQYAGANYRQAIESYVTLLHTTGLAVVLDLHWAAPGSTLATQQMPMPDADHAPAFWSSVAATFKDDPRVVFDLYNEPFAMPSNAETGDAWDCWLHGCRMRPGYGVGDRWQSSGMQALLDAVRAAGARQPVIAGGLAWASDLTGWLAHRPDDPEQQVAAAFHLYNFAGCHDSACWDSQVAPVTANVPVVTGELGENDCAGGFIDRYMRWADQHGVSYLGWTWDTWPCGSGPALISSYAGTPTALGAVLRAHLATAAVRMFAPSTSAQP